MAISEAEEESLGLGAFENKSSTVGERVGGILHSSGGVKTSMEWHEVATENGEKGMVREIEWMGAARLFLSKSSEA